MCIRDSYNPIEHVKSRLKTPESIVKKLKSDGREVSIENMIEYLNDIAGIRIICSFTSDIYQIADMIAKQSDVTVLNKMCIRDRSYTVTLVPTLISRLVTWVLALVRSATCTASTERSEARSRTAPSLVRECPSAVP